MEKCPCGARNSPDPLCDMCDGYSNDPDTGWGGYTNNFTDKHYNSVEEEEQEEENSNSFFGQYYDEDDEE